jgi:hypothetical protein
MPAKKQKQQPKQPKFKMKDDNIVSIDSLTVSDSNVIDLSNYASTSSYTLGSGISSISGSITVPTSYATSYTLGSSYSWNDPNVNISSDGITMKQESDLKIGDRSLKDFMDRVEDQLAILRPAPELEEKWDQLKELRRQYETLKKDILEKEKIMKILKEK